MIDLKSLLSKKRFGKALLSLPLVHRPWWHILYDVCSVVHHVFVRGFATARPQGHKDQIDLSLFASLPLHIFCMFYSTKNLRRIFWESRFQTQVESKHVFVSMFASVGLPTQSLCLKTSVDVAQRPLPVSLPMTAILPNPDLSTTYSSHNNQGHQRTLCCCFLIWTIAGQFKFTIGLF